MTHDEITKLEAGRELDALVAEHAMKLERRDYVKSCETKTVFYMVDVDRDNDVYLCNPTFNSEHHKNGVWFYEWRKFGPSTDMAAAWQVVEKIKNDGWMPNIVYHQSDMLWHCEYFNNLRMRNATAPTAPLAICRAALLAAMR